MIQLASSVRALLVLLAVLALGAMRPAAVHAEPPTSKDVLAMRSAAAREAAVGELSRVQVKAEAREQAAPSTTQAAAVQLPAAHIRAQQPTSSAAQHSSTEADVALIERCYELAQRTDTSLVGPVIVHLVTGADGLSRVQVKDENLGNHHYVRCLQRDFGRFPVLPQLPAPDPTTRVVVVGSAAAVADPEPAGAQPLAVR